MPFEKLNIKVEKKVEDGKWEDVTDEYLKEKAIKKDAKK